MNESACSSPLSVEGPEAQSARAALQAGEKWFLTVLIFLSLAPRLIGITQPFVDSWSWKQLTNAMVSRNFYLHGYHFFYPQVDWAGPYPGYSGTELPLVPFLASVLYAIFGIHEWIGRSISVFFFLAAVPAFYLLVRKLSTRRSACVATAAYCIAPLAFFASRSFQSDITSLSFGIIAIYLFSEWLDDPNSKTLFISASTVTSLAILVKVPQVIIAVPFFYMCWVKYGRALFRRRELWAFLVLSLILPLAWELHAYHVSVTYYPYHFAGARGIRVMSWSFYWDVIQRAVDRWLTPILATALIVGTLIYPHRKYGAAFHWWLVAFFFFFVAAGWENRHPWVQLPLVPIAAAFSGFIFDRVSRRLKTLARPVLVELTLAFAFLLPLGLFSYRSLAPRYRPWQQPGFNAAMELKKISPPGALVLAVDYGEPTIIYYSERKGWHFLPIWGTTPNDDAHAIQKLEELRAQGATHLVFDQYSAPWLELYKDFTAYLDTHYRRRSQTSDYVIYDISTPSVGRAG